MSNMLDDLKDGMRDIYYTVLGVVAIIVGGIAYSLFRIFEKIVGGTDESD